MSYIEILGGLPLKGSIGIQGSKNAALPILAGCILGEGQCTIKNCPDIKDVRDTLVILKGLGCKVIQKGSTICVDNAGLCQEMVGCGEAARIRSSILFLGALLGKRGRADLPLPGGCLIGKRPIDFHLQALSSMGAEISCKERLRARAKTLTGRNICLPKPSVGATENVILAAVGAKGITQLQNAAMEPEIDELCRFLTLRGAGIRLIQPGVYEIEGGKKLGSADYTLEADRIVAGTYLLAAAGCGGEIKITNYPWKTTKMLTGLMTEMGAQIWQEQESCIVKRNQILRPVSYIETAPYPGFPTDLQSLLAAVLTKAEGISCIRETVFEQRFHVVGELRKMGADIRALEDQILIRGPSELRSAQVTVPDLRSGAALVLAGLMCRGKTRIENYEYIERGYEDICRDFQRIGARMKKTALRLEERREADT